ncbi:MAG: DUF4912 domain-containing protein [Fibrobacter sp.]|nr:DUF4912 domain-containing protein [Fibrobacter sp.]
MKSLKVSKDFSDSQKKDNSFAETEDSDCDISAVQPENSISDTPQENVNCGPRYAFSTEIPEKYDESYICAIPRNPQEMFVYWELSSDDNAEVNSCITDSVSNLLLRLRDKDSSLENLDSENESFLIELDNSDSSKVIELPESGKEYVVESGYITQDGAFKPLASSMPAESQESDTQSDSVTWENFYRNGAEAIFYENVSEESDIDNREFLNISRSKSSPQKW